MTATYTSTCPRCGQSYPFDSITGVMSKQCGECDYEDSLDAHRLVPTAQRYAGFVESMRAVDTPTLTRWLNNNNLTQPRRTAAGIVLLERLKKDRDETVMVMRNQPTAFLLELRTRAETSRIKHSAISQVLRERGVQ